MKVKELIDKLSCLDPEMTVAVFDYEENVGYTITPAEYIKVTKKEAWILQAIIELDEVKDDEEFIHII